jgi:glycogen phosphorylase
MTDADRDVLAGLTELATNLRWAWDRPSQDVFAAIDPPRWAVRREPAAMVRSLPPQRLAELAADADFRERLRLARAGLADYLAGGGQPATVAYFCMEYGVAPALRTYAGGLGMLAGDILKTASDLRVPMVGVGLRYRWWMRQRLSYGWQNEEWVPADPLDAGLQRCPEGDVTVELAGEPVAVQVWRARVGRLDLYLLDTDAEVYDGPSPGITDRLYGGDAEHRLRQELVLGVGGVRVLAALGHRPEVFHANEGHAGFLCLERIRELVAGGGDVGDAMETVRRGTVFTTHTAVPAGFDLFDRGLVEKYFAGWSAETGVSPDRLMALGHFPDQQPGEPFNMAVLCARLSGRVDAVSRLHREVTEQRVLGRLWPGRAAPVEPVTNGVHPASWTPPSMAALFDRYVGPGWEYAGAEEWQGVWDIPDEELWAARQEQRAGLVGYARAYLPQALSAQGWAEDLGWASEVLDPAALTVVVARRAAEYKETDLLVSLPDRLRALTGDRARPVCVLFAGLAHPKDQGGKERIRRIVEYSLGADVRSRVVFLPGYDMVMAQWLLAGADLWLNHPRRGDEACGTSFMKSVYAGGRIVSTADGGVDELVVDGRNGWLIGDRAFGTPAAVVAQRAFELFEGTVVPQFHDRDAAGVPREWVCGIKRSLASLGWQVSSARMSRTYEWQYRDAARERAACFHGTRSRGGGGS